jgi:hypothetical protein
MSATITSKCGNVTNNLARPNTFPHSGPQILKHFHYTGWKSGNAHMYSEVSCSTLGRAVGYPSVFLSLWRANLEIASSNTSRLIARYSVIMITFSAHSVPPNPSSWNKVVKQPKVMNVTVEPLIFPFRIWKIPCSNSGRKKLTYHHFLRSLQANAGCYCC